MAVSGEQPIVIKKVKKVVGGGHHGGAWKVAYADFVTAMMAFFLLMWLLNTTSPEQKQGIADYFAPASISSSTSGSGGILGGTSLGDDGAKADGKMSVIQQMAPEAPTETDKDGQSSTSASLDSASEQALRDALAKKEQDSFASAAQSLRQSLQDMPELAELSKQIMIDQTPEGLRIQLIDQDGRSMFKENSREPNDRARILLRAVAKVINQLPNRITISGHTSASAAGKRSDSDWSLSAERADASRQVLRGAGVDEDRIYQVSGKANSEPLYADDPTLPGNRRISIVLLREKPVLPDGL
ncbi:MULTISPECIES: flagellar motor protein MotB [Caulobacter]|jgi:chemotaxis protein MotB|uniref:Chemotaxis protein MotB n=1 Tax=Caulobacter rhizosphaerae TaxID=2010972 RepID=A0ABU1MTW7_9CAUL|nr:MULTISPECIES: flagellar motor protein MotB [Caulobacter]KQZ21902.1 chemotaxis protein MotB [Caulobacter sp. Root1472]MDR6529638.1 chemotaxis protein MotB [Caulobacter rhizosphaerae]GGL24988.1 chemotaxis protein MotB [Caulobacter rhizosphaerae]HWU12748.1 flagellar motor protein MotB [Caulobacter sp.]